MPDVKVGAAYVDIGARLGPLKEGLQAAHGMVRSAISGMGRILTAPLRLVGGAFRAVFGRESLEALKGIAGLRGVGLVGGLGYAVRKYQEFERQLALVSTALTEEHMPLMRQYERAIRELAQEFGQSTDTISRGLYDILSASVAPEKALDVLRVATHGAVGGFTDVATTVSGLLNVLNAFQLGPERAADVMDVLFAVVRRGRIWFDQLAVGISEIASMAAVLGLDFRTLAANIATITRAGVPPAQAFAALRALLNALIDPMDDAVRAARELGIDISLARVQSEGLIPVILDMARADSKQVEAMGGKIGAFRALAPVLVNLEGQQQDLNVMMHAGGEAMVAYAKAADTLSFRLARLREWAIDKLVTVGDWLVRQWERLGPQLMAALRNLWAGVQSAIAPLLDGIQQMQGQAASFLQRLWNFLLERIATLDIPIRKAVAIIRSGLDDIVALGDWLLDWLGTLGRNMLRVLWGVLRAAGTLAIAVIGPIADVFFEKLSDAISQGIGRLLGKWRLVLGTMYTPLLAVLGKLPGPEPPRPTLAERLAAEFSGAMQKVPEIWGRTMAGLEQMPPLPRGELTARARVALAALDIEQQLRIAWLHDMLQQLALPAEQIAETIGRAIEEMKSARILRGRGMPEEEVEPKKERALRALPAVIMPAGFMRFGVAAEERQLTELRGINRRLDQLIAVEQRAGMFGP